MAPSRLLSHLQDLRNDIVFLRADIDQALRRYELITEGETLPDALQKDLSEIENLLGFITYTHSNMGRLLKQMYRGLPSRSEVAIQDEKKQSEVSLYNDSYSLHEGKCIEITNLLKNKLKTFNRKSVLLRVATNDLESEGNIRSMLTKRLQSVEQDEIKLKQSIEQFRYYLAHPNEIPDELRNAE